MSKSSEIKAGTQKRPTSDFRRPTALNEAPNAITLPELPPLSLYIHIPWCVRKCPYCDFNSHQRHGDVPQAAYVRALLDDLDNDIAYAQGRALQSIFFGGGTPSLFSAQAIGDIVEGVARRLDFSSDIEITLEANPGTFEQQKFRDYRTAGVNRLSLGVQSFQPRLLQALGRIHDEREAIHAIAAAREAGFQRLNIDLMHGLPGQTVDAALADLQRGLALGLSHLSWYQLTIEPNTEFFKRPPRLPAEELLGDIQERGHALLLEHGLQQYEVSAYAAPGQQARHNLNYWRFGDYLAIGAGAHGKVTLPDQQQILRYQKTRKPEDYLGRVGSRTSDRRGLDVDELPLEFMMNALRLVDGVELELFSRRTGLPWSVIEQRVQSLLERELLEITADRIRPTALGRRYLDDVVAAFLPHSAD